MKNVALETLLLMNYTKKRGEAHNLTVGAKGVGNADVYYL
jgi:hypothetical protein